MKTTKSSILLITFVAVTLVSSTMIYLPSTSIDDSSSNDAENTQTMKGDANNSSETLQPSTPFSVFPFERTIDEAQKKVELFKIKVPPQSVLPTGYQLVGTIPNPLGPVSTDPFSGRTFRPQNVLLYYWNMSITDLDMDVQDFYEGGGIIIDEMYALGANSTEPHFVGVKEIPPHVTVGWFNGFPGVWYNGYAEVFQFEENISYRVWGKFLTKEQALAIIETLLIE